MKIPVAARGHRRSRRALGIRPESDMDRSLPLDQWRKVTSIACLPEHWNSCRSCTPCALPITAWQTRRHMAIALIRRGVLEELP